MRFAPIAIVGRGCVLPSALSPGELWELALRGGSAIAAAPARDWQVDPAIDRASMPREIASQAGGHVHGFERVWDPRGFQIEADTLAGLDPVFTWTLHAAREAVRSAGLDPMAPRPRGIVVLGNLSYPVPALSELALDVWERGSSGVDPRNRFMSGLPAQLAAAALGFGAGGFALDAACASSLYAIKLACDRLHDGAADIALAGGVNHADDLFLHLGFTALSALSPTGQSRPFHRRADGLVPAQGAAMVALRRLADAEADGAPILGVIRGIGLANDGRGRGLLVPVEHGQIRAMRAAYAESGVSPDEVSLVECHATGTAVGDAVELRSMRAVFGGARDLPIGSLKSNLGHLITASGAASLLKVLGAIDAGIRPPTLHADEPLDELAAGPFRALTAAEPWPSDGPRRAAISSFGFGGNNAHLVVEQWLARPHGFGPGRHPAPPQPVAPPRAEIAVIAQEVIAGAAANADAFAGALLAGRPDGMRRPGETFAATGGAVGDFDLDVARLRFPPSDLADALPQQTLLCRAVLALSDVLDRIPRERTSVLVGMQCDAEIARCSLRWRRRGVDAGRSTAGPLDAAVVLGCMPNIVANRLSSALDVAGPSFTVSADEASGTVALDLALRSLAAGEIDAALVCAVDLCCEPVHRLAAEAVLPADRRTPGDAAVVLVLKRLADARRDRDPVLAVLESDNEVPLDTPRASSVADRLAALFGHAHAASGLLQVAAAVTACQRRATLPRRAASPAMPWLPTARGRRTHVHVRALGGMQTSVAVRVEPGAPGPRAPSVQLALYAADDVAGLVRALERDVRGVSGPVRAAIVASTPAQHEQRIARAVAALRDVADNTSYAMAAEGVHLGRGPMVGELAFVFTGPAGAYPRMGRELLLDLPELVTALAARMPGVRDAAGWLYDDDAAAPVAPADKLWGSSFLVQTHAELTRGLLGIRPHAAIGYCSGETNALFALGAWSDLDGFRRAIDDSGLYTRELAGELQSVRRAWGLPDGAAVAWSALRVLAPVREIRAALVDEPRVHLTIQNAARDAVIAGDAAACARVAARLGAHRVRPLDYDFVMHCPEARPLAAVWRALHHRPTAPVPGVRFYTHATLSSYAPTADTAADALTGQAMSPVDFPALVERAYADGIRIFIEHGPHAGCTRWIDDTLGDRPHLAVALDRYGQSSTVQAADAVARLFAAGVPMDAGALAARLSRPAPPRGDRARGHVMRVAAHPPPVRFTDPESTLAPESTHACEVMAPAPALPPVLPRRLPATPSDGTRRRVPLAELHVAFLHQQAAAHEEFLRLMVGVLGLRDPALPTTAVPASMIAPAPDAARSLSTPAGREAPQPRGPRFDRSQLETLASGRISSVFGPLFTGQEGHARQVRMPEPPLLLADRVLGIDGAPGEMGVGTIWTQTDVTEDAWYLHAGRMPAGILVEAGQADLLLISWLGADRLNRGERVYRLLGCELTSHGELPRRGDTLTYEIHVDGHASQGDVRLFFFHYDCWANGELRVTVRGGQAGFFTDAELATSEGVLWTAEGTQATPHARLDPPAVACTKRAFTAAELDAFIAGRAEACFGPGFERLATHVVTPAIQGGAMRLIDEVTRFEPDGGPWKRGYLRARLALRSDHWFFRGHFKGDPCMPGTLMFEGCLQALATYMVALGFTLERDGWRFEPVVEHTYHLRCRGQALPTSREVVYEVFVDEIIGGPQPTIFADLLGTVDGLRAFHCRRMGLRLVPGWPLEILAAAATPAGEARVEALPPFGDFRALLACAWGRPSDAFGDMYRAFDGPRRVARLPGPPYHFMSRVTRVGGPMGGMQVGSTVEAEYDVPRDAWYFADNHAPVVPFSVLLEIALQPCGWLASYVGCALASASDLVFRNLEGTGTVWPDAALGVAPDRAIDLPRALGPGAGTLTTLTTRATLTSCSAAAGAILVGFDVAVRRAGAEVMTLETVFGFFGADSMKHQIGLVASDEARAAIAAPGNADIDLAARPGRWFPGGLRVASGRLLMLDRVVHLAPHGGRAGLGQIRAYKDVAAGDWYFKAHFFQDPVQPGSLGLDAMLQALQILMIERGMDEGVDDPRFEPIASGTRVAWKYRGQVVPENRRVTVEVDIVHVERDARGPRAEGCGSLWVDGKRIYEATLTMRIVPGSRPPARAGFDREATRRFWRDATAMVRPWVGEDVLFALLDRFVRCVHIETPLARRGRPGAVYLANHQVAVETVLAALIIGGMTDAPPVLVAKSEHRDSWVGALTALFAERPGYRDPGLLRFVDRADPSAVLALRRALAGDLQAGRGVLVHVEGTRATRGGHAVGAMSSVFLDLAVEASADLVPLRFTGGLPVDGDQRRDFPVGYGAQDYWFGRPIAAAELRALRFDARIERVRAAIDALGGPLELESPSPPALAFEARVGALRTAGVPEPQAVVRCALDELVDASPETRAILDDLAPPDDRAIPWLRALARWLRAEP